MNDLYLNSIDLNNIDLNDIEKLSAYIDNELSPKDRTELERRLAIDGELLQALTKLEQSNELAKTYFSELDNKPLPMNLEAMILKAKPTDAENAQTEPKLDLESKTATIIDIFRNKKNKLTSQSWGLATAASMIFALGMWMFMPTTQPNVDTSVLALLNTQPSGSVTTVSPELKIELLASYQNSQGSICRSLIEHTPISSNPTLACLNQGKWQIETTDLGDNYQTASSSERQNKQELMTKKQEQIWLKAVNK